jgi:outer membrane beta-barrel protein
MTFTRSNTALLVVVVAALGVLTTAPALAAGAKKGGGDSSNDDVLDKPVDKAPAPADDEDKPAADDEKPADKGADAAAAAPAQAAPLEDTIYVVQGKPFLAKGKFEISPQLAQSVNDSFTSHTGAMVSGLYHLKENVAFEVAAGAFGWWDVGGPRFGGRDSELTVELRQKESLAPERVKLYQFPWVVAADAQWSPLYGKVDIHDAILGQFNLYLSVGAGVFGLQLESLTQNGIQKAYVNLPPTFGALPTMALSTTFGGGLRFYFTDWLGVRVEVRDYVIPLSVREEEVIDADGPSFDVTNLVLGQAGVSFVF